MSQTIVVTGGAGDIGQALCRRFLGDGHRVAMLDRSGEALSRAVAALGSPDQLLGIEADVTSLASVQSAVGRIEKRFGGIGVLVNNAGGVVSPTLGTTQEADWLADIDLNLNGAWRCVRAVQDGMIARGRGTILNISSVNGSGIYGYPAYSAAKAGLNQMTRFLAVELGRHGIRANAIAPGSVKTQAWKERVEKNPEIFERLKRWYPLSDICVPDDIAGVAAFLIGPDARMITGAVLPVDGGLSVGSTTMAREFCGADF
ncbi:SDR family oxidoreductase [Microvirga subterranea]|uniref:NAD(P)-dependent dehydrogenase (Short-subunit alcohol dehydrogenase family) n=1 Tax=Microvirga subterranea TaxID=186651 RepID=A0A370HXE4_9HYPH|nr:SDR family oxidoreductase [Microvirga subterranea]RDI62621.1 NAD(P)-dependent dehydrogenase (short-subunit alcohol dehydrogenase family) [Microvirga subterranea]